jgi:hypothetical protein
MFGLSPKSFRCVGLLVDSSPTLRYNTFLNAKGNKMQANTKQVRAIMRNAIAQCNAGDWRFRNTWTEKTTHKFPARRSVVFSVTIFEGAAVLAAVKAEFAKLGYTNKVKTTGDGYYLRCIADLA